MSTRLPLPVRRILRDDSSDAAVDAAWQRRQLGRPRRSLAIPATGALVVLAAAAALAVVVSRGGEPGPLLLDDGELPGVLVGEDTIDLSDGSSLALDATARVEPLENDGRAFDLLLEGGRTTFDVTPGGPRRWTIECGLATVVVVGTRFTVDRSPERLVVSVERGAVLVRGDRVENGARRLGAGDSIVITAASDAEAASPPARSMPAVHGPPTTDPAITPPSVPSTPAPAPRASTWRADAERGAYDEAYAELGATGLRREISHATPEGLLTLADVARLSGHPAESIAPLERILSEHASDPSAGLAAFTLGCVEADSMHRPARATRAFERAIDLALPRALLPDAIARLARARDEAGDSAGAHAAAQRYLAEFPEGAQARSMSALLEAAP